MPHLTGLEVIRDYVASTSDNERAQILMMTAHATIESAIEAMKLGALDYLQKRSRSTSCWWWCAERSDHQRLRPSTGTCAASATSISTTTGSSEAAG